MKCPVCKEVNLSISERQGIEIDYCPQCRGVWLDRGELDRIIERTESERDTPPPAYQPAQRQTESTYSRHDHHHRKKRHKSLLADLFDFG
tara:strand:+ start:21669 stop:21938 length:270 start_codon:yes stop_codon:yes gene_type:complete